MTAVVIPGPCRFVGLFGRDSDYVVPWCCIRRRAGIGMAGAKKEKRTFLKGEALAGADALIGPKAACRKSLLAPLPARFSELDQFRKLLD